MQVERHVKQITLPAFADPPNPHCATPAHSLSTSFTLHPQSSWGRSSALRNSADTPLASYALQRSRAPPMYTSREERTRAVHAQVPLSVLSSPQAHLGAVGGSFNSTTMVKCVPLPTLFDRHQVTRHGVRSVSMHASRFIPRPQHSRTVSDSLLHLPRLAPRHMHQRIHLGERERQLKTSRSLKCAGEVVPHRLDRAFYMSGQSAQLFDKEQITPEELRVLQELSLAQNPALYYGRGIRSYGGVTLKAVEKFKESVRRAEESSDSYVLAEASIDAGRYSRASAITPAPTIAEEREERGREETERDDRTFVTQSLKHTQQ